MKKKQLIKKVFLLLSPVLLVALIGWSLRQESDFFLVREVPVEVEFENSQSALIDELRPIIASKLKTLEGENIWKLRLGKIRKDLLDLPWLEEVKMSRRFPDKISAKLKFRPISLLYVNKKNNIFPVSQDGYKFKQVKPGVAPIAPILRNEKIMADSKKLEKVISLLEQIPNLGPLKKENIASVDFNSITGLTIELIEEDVLVHLGEEDIPTKGLQVLRVTDYLKSQKLKARVIDASFSKKVLVRPRKRS